jgi:hypothetical protein
MYLYNNTKWVWTGDPSNKEVKYYGNQLGTAFQLVVGSAGATAAIVKIVPKMAKLLGKIKPKKSSSSNSSSKKSSDGCNCFVAGTKVLTDEGEKNIEDIEVGDMVLSKDEVNGELAYKEITATFNHETDEIYNIHVDGQTIEATFNHPFYVEGKGWTFVKDLKPGDLLVQSDGNTLKVDSIELLHKRVTVYNMTVDEFHTYFVSELGIWVHNTEACKIKGASKVKTYEQARNEALSWLKQRGFKSEKPTFGKFGYTKNKPIGRQTNDGKVGFRIEYDSRSGAHINVWAGKEKGPHFEFDASEKTVKKIQKLFK